MLPTPPPPAPWGRPLPVPPDPGWSRPPWTPDQPRHSRRRTWLFLAGGPAAFVVLVVVLVLIGRNPTHVGSNGESAKPTDVIVGDTDRALASATYVHVWGSMTVNGEREGLDLDMGTGWTTGSITAKGATAQVVLIGDDVYLRGRDFVAASAGKPYPLRVHGALVDTSFDLHFGDFDHDLPAPSPPQDVFGAPGPTSV